MDFAPGVVAELPVKDDVVMSPIDETFANTRLGREISSLVVMAKHMTSAVGDIPERVAV